MSLIKVKTRGTENVTGRRNILINGAMQVDQRGATVTFAHDGTSSSYVVDRWRFSMGGTHEQLDGTMAQVADNPFGGTGKSLKWTTGTPESSADTDEYNYITQIVEAQNLHHIQNGNSNAKKLTLSFWVKSSITGTYAVGLYKGDNTGRMRNLTYAISSANTWEKKSVTFEGDTAGGGINNDNGQGMYVIWHLSAGGVVQGGASSDSAWVDYATNTWAQGHVQNGVVTTAGATFQLTECQLEVGDEASDFEHRSFGEELSLCQRYYQRTQASASGYQNLVVLTCYGTGTDQRGVIPFVTEMRTGPAVSTSGNLMILGAGGSLSSINAGDGLTTHMAGLRVNTSSNLSTGQSTLLRGNNDGTAHLQFDAEL